MSVHLDPNSLVSPSRLSDVRRSLSSVLTSAQERIERHSVALFGVLLVFYAVWCYAASQAKPFWFDELLGLSAATQPHFRDVLPALAKGVDFNPPLFHYLQRVSIDVFGLSTTAARLPAFLGMTVFLICVFVLISRRLNAMYGLLAGVIILCTTVREYGWEGRPYALVLGFTGIALLAYQRRLERPHSASALLLIAIVSACLTATHYYAVLIVGTFAAAEIVAAFQRKRIDWPWFAALIGPAAAVLAVLKDVIRSQKSQMAHYHSAGGPRSFIEGYGQFEIPTWTLCLAIVCIAAACWIDFDRQPRDRDAAQARFSTGELVLAFLLLALPFAGSLATVVLHAYAPRYFMAGVAGYAILICYTIAMMRNSRLATMFLCCCGAACLLFYALPPIRHQFSPSAKRGGTDMPLANLQEMSGLASTSVVFQDAKDYLSALELNPAMKSQFYYAAEPELAVKMIGSDSDDRIMRTLATLRPLQVTTLDALAGQDRGVLIVPGSFGWLQSCLEEMGTELRVQHFRANHGSLTGLAARLPKPGVNPVHWCEADAKANSVK